MPEAVPLEGAGDCIWDRTRGLFWMGCGFRSDPAASRVVEQTFGVRCLPLALADPSFYHLDTAFCALPCGSVLYHPGAFSDAALETIHHHIAPAQRIALNRADAARFAANAVCIGRVGGDVELQRCAAARPGRSRLHGCKDAAAGLPAQRRVGLLPDATA